jgi:hypothetical protein
LHRNASEVSTHRSSPKCNLVHLCWTPFSVSTMLVIQISCKSLLPGSLFWRLSPYLPRPKFHVKRPAAPLNSPHPHRHMESASEEEWAYMWQDTSGKNWQPYIKRHKTVSTYQSDATPSEWKTMGRRLIIQWDMIHFEPCLINSGTPPLHPSPPLHHLSAFV